ncbi:MAG: hypothetical protein ACRDO7_09020 [Nocardioidaceae bacterium]
MSKVLASLVAAVLAAGLLLAPSAASAQSTGWDRSLDERASSCVSKKEYRKVQRGTRIRRVHRIFDTRGKQTSTFTIGGVRYQSREYKPCSSQRWGFVSIDYKNGRSTDKYAYWG